MPSQQQLTHPVPGSRPLAPPFSSKKNQGSSEKWLTLGLGQETPKTSPE